MISCAMCGDFAVEQLLDLGPQPIANRFLKDPSESEFRHPLRLGQCVACGLLQLIGPPAPDELRPRLDWITYREPEGHLDRLADVLRGLPGVDEEAVLCGVSFKDDSLLSRLRERGIRNTWRLDRGRDLRADYAGVGVETVANRLNVTRAAKLVKSLGWACVVIARHILEHAHRPREFLGALKDLVQPGGYLVLEVPDCTRALELGDCTTLWEEHSVYFTLETFRQSIVGDGLRVRSLEVVPYPLENSLVAILERNTGGSAGQLPAEVLEAERERARRFRDRIRDNLERVQRFCAERRSQGQKVALLGAGHLACMFVNLGNLGPYMDFVADDDPKKQGLFMPGSRLPIRAAESLLQEGVTWCFLSVNPEVEEHIVQKHHRFVVAGGNFASIFPSSRYALT